MAEAGQPEDMLNEALEHILFEESCTFAMATNKAALMSQLARVQTGAEVNSLEDAHDLPLE